MKTRPLAICAFILALAANVTRADPPSVAYLYPAGGQRGTKTQFKVGGYNLHDSAALEMRGEGIETVDRIQLTNTLFFEGPVIPQPASQAKEDYPRDYAGHVTIAADAALGIRYWHVATSQGITAGKKFVIGDLPEVIEREVDGNPIPMTVTLPVTINGRIFPREDVDVWTFAAKAGRAVTCEVNAARLGSPLDSRLEVRDPSGRPIAQNVDAIGTDSRLRFVPERDGIYEVRIHDVKFGGLQSYVYRLTVTAGPIVDTVFPLGGKRGSSINVELSGANLPQTSVTVRLPTDDQSSFTYRPQFDGQRAGILRLELDNLPESIETSDAKQPQLVTLPVICNGRIALPGDIDEWSFTAKKDDQFDFDLRASRLGSPLDSVLTVFDAAGKQLAQNDDLGKGQTDSRLTFKVLADGTYRVRIEDRLSSRGGPTFAYRLKISQPKVAAAEFHLTLPSDVANIERGKEFKLKIDVQRLGGFKDEIALAIDNLPAGVALSGPAKIDKGKNTVQLVLKAEAQAKVATGRLVVRGTATIDGKQVEQRATLALNAGRAKVDELRLRVAVPTPFKFAGAFSTQYASRGTVYTRYYTLERGGFGGPIEVRMADVQARHLQGVTGPVITIPPEKTEFDYSITLPPWMVIGRTSRTCVMAVGDVVDADGTKHKVSYSSTAQNDQVIVLVDPARLSVRIGSPSIRATPGRQVRVPFQIERGAGLKGPVKVALILPRHIKGVKAEAVEVSATGNSGELLVTFDDGQPGPFNMPLIIRAMLRDEEGNPVTAEAPLTVVPAQ
jgi:hypothetical protein